MNTPLVTTLTDWRDIADNTLEFVLQRPVGFDFKAGQHINVKLTDLIFDDKKAGRRMFTIASAPHEEHLVFATRKTGSGFKRSLEHSLQQQVEIIGPRGNLVRDESRPAVFVAGGIGVTPFRSMLMDALFRNIDQPITLLSSNRSASEVVFHDQFLKVAADCPTLFKYIPTITQEHQSNGAWSGKRRRIDVNLIKEHVPDFSAATFYVCGPNEMVTAMSDMLIREKNQSRTHPR